MKKLIQKLLIIPMLLTLIIFYLYHTDIDGMPAPQTVTAPSEILIGEGILEVYNNSMDEMNKTGEVNETEEAKRFSISIKGDLNITRDTVLKLVAEVNNTTEISRCNYWWYEGKELIDMGATLEKAFSKGEHDITVVVRDANGTETNSSVTVNAYDYYSIKRLNYDPHYGNLLSVEKQTMNHQGMYVLYDDGTYLKEYSFYDENSNLTERTVEYYLYPSENRKISYTYDDNANRLTSQTFDAQGESIYYSAHTYDDNGTVVTTKRGTNENDLVDEDYSMYEGAVYYEDPYVVTPSEEDQVAKDIIELNDNGQVIYEELYYGDAKAVNKMSYDEDNKITRSERHSISSYDSRLQIMDYNKDGQVIKKEIKYALEDREACHYMTESTYTSIGQIESEVSTFLGGVCPFIDDVKRVFKYDAEGVVINVKANIDGEEGTGFTTLKVVKEYTNELDI
ncbi:MAG: Unknown protein [uncultured Sulfurovum sp.]|uniref:Uncharacterized protein n=1 Tax=uncultured Sulfurovum sp. TaxID=269237 RepID=A0A6S6T5I8_9BACT|nr:MAG: Unknown protein [uncultured Sulfurovum sp.]